MQASLTGDDLFAELLMQRTADPRTAVLLEGSTDCQALDPHIDEEWARTVPGFSKSAVERAVQLVDQRGFDRVLAILDRDFVGLIHVPIRSGNLVYTDDYDLEATILFSGDVLDRVTSSVVDRDAMQAHLGSAGVSSRDLLVRLAGTVGIARLVSIRDELQIRLDRFPIHEVLNAQQTDLDIDTLALIAVRRSKRALVDEGVLAERIRLDRENRQELRPLCNGHDLSAALSALLKARWGGGALAPETVEKVARAALSCDSLQSTQLYGAVAEWAIRASTRVWCCG